MSRWFTHAPLERRLLERCITPLTSMFSHKSFTHLACNMIGMTSFAGGAGYYISSQNVQLGGQYKHDRLEPQELSGKYQFLAFFITAGLFASLSSTLHARFVQRKILQSASPSIDALRVANRPGLGASGAIYSVVVVSTLADPEHPISIIFLPFFSFAAKYGVMGLVGLDMYGLWAGWRVFGHATHLGGAAFGALYFYFGPQMWAAIRGPETRSEDGRGKY